MWNFLPVAVAQEVSPTPSAETASVSSTQAPANESTPSPTDPNTLAAPEVSNSSDSSNTSNVSDPSATIAPSPTPDPLSNWNNLTDQQKDEYRDAKKAEASAAYLSSQGITQPTSGSGNSGDTSIATGDAQNNGAVFNSANNNFASSPLNGGPGGSLSVLNNGNGSSSENSGSATIINDDTTEQDNSAYVISGLHGSSTTGDNDGNFNVGDTNLASGDANTTGTIINAVNTNVDGVMVSEFNIVDDHVGDIILDFAANCISGCGFLGQSLQNTANPARNAFSIANAGGGANSTNTADGNIINNNTTFQNNDGTVGNEMVLGADSGNNSSSYNTGGDSTITTGDANIAGNALTFLNNNISGNVVFSVVNVFGDLIGDIIFPESQLSCCGGSAVTAANTGNPARNASSIANAGGGADSTNTANASLANSDATFQNNDATINNNLVFDATTGNNSTGYNTGGNSTVTTGQANVDANVLNIANTNIIDGNMWLVLINHAGNWVGKLVGAPEGQSYLGSEGMEFAITPTGEISVSNNENGASSTNTANASAITNNTTTQNNTGTVNNTLRFNANTGGNDANFNTGGDSTITTGDANIIANLVNFVNNNIVGNGKLFVSIVNVFGSWTGDFVTPGSHKEVESHQVIKSSSDDQNSNSSNNNNSNQQSIRQAQDMSAISNDGLINNLNGGNEAKTGNVTLSSNFNNSGNGNTATSGSTTNTVSQNGLLASTKVLAMNTQDTNRDKKIRINLAWLLLLLPLLALVIAVRRMTKVR